MQIDAARWLGSRLAPKRYGMKAELAEASEQRAEPTLVDNGGEEVKMMNVILTSYIPGVPDALVRFLRDKGSNSKA